MEGGRREKQVFWFPPQPLLSLLKDLVSCSHTVYRFESCIFITKLFPEKASSGASEPAVPEGIQADTGRWLGRGAGEENGAFEEGRDSA